MARVNAGVDLSAMRNGQYVELSFALGIQVVSIDGEVIGGGALPALPAGTRLVTLAALETGRFAAVARQNASSTSSGDIFDVVADRDGTSPGPFATI